MSYRGRAFPNSGKILSGNLLSGLSVPEGPPAASRRYPGVLLDSLDGSVGSSLAVLKKQHTGTVRCSARRGSWSVLTKSRTLTDPGVAEKGTHGLT
ncbi:hypothetical protein KM043_011470 [Ampulex compressa]|nr:hypothetical protein KM043_011470 [Ampulex compressa]